MLKLTMTLKLITEQILNKSFNIFFVLFCFGEHASTLHFFGSIYPGTLKYFIMGN